MGWAFFYMFVILKIPVVAACLLVWWAVRNEGSEIPGEHGDGGRGPHHPRPRGPRPPRRGPHAEPLPRSPARVRTISRLPRRVH